MFNSILVSTHFHRKNNKMATNYVKVYIEKSAKMEPIGIKVKEIDGKVLITAVDEDALAYGKLQVNDEIVSINCRTIYRKNDASSIIQGKTFHMQLLPDYCSPAQILTDGPNLNHISVSTLKHCQKLL